MTEAKSAQPQLPPRPIGEDSMKLNAEYIREWLVSYKASFGIAIPSAGLPASHVVENVEWLLAENESLKAQLEERNNRGTGFLYVPKAAYEVVKAERDKMLEVIREYRELHRSCKERTMDLHVFHRCSTCIKADELLLRKEK